MTTPASTPPPDTPPPLLRPTGPDWPITIGVSVLTAGVAAFVAKANSGDLTGSLAVVAVFVVGAIAFAVGGKMLELLNRK
jgi:hypothetical protein